MAYHLEKSTGDLVINGFEQGIARSPLSGIANLQAVNISTENKEVMCSFARIQQSMTVSTATGSLAFVDSSHVSLAITNTNNLFKGMWITVTASTHSGELSNADYYVLQTAGSNFVLSSSYNGAAITGYTAGLTASFTLKRNMGNPISSTTEYYNTASSLQYRYYILDANGLVWVLDSATVSPTDNIGWSLPLASLSGIPSNPSSVAVLSGWLFMFGGNAILAKPTVNLGASFSILVSDFQMMSLSTSANPHFAFVGHQGKLYYTDGNYIGSVFPDSSLVSGVENIQSYSSYTAVSTTGTLTAVISGSVPIDPTAVRIPIFFFPATGGTLPATITLGTVYYIHVIPGNTGTFQVFSAASGGSALDIATGATGTQYFNTFYPTSSDGQTAMTVTSQRLNLPEFEVATSMAEIGNLVVIGTKSNVLYPWNQVDATPGDLIPLPESNTSFMLTVNNMAYIFAGNKGNVYLTNGSTAALVTTVPDYCAGIAGTPASYIEPSFIWGGAMYLRGRVYFSILDQTSSKVGNCGGIWSFVPTQNFFIGQDTGLSLRMENQNSYGTYSGVATVLLANKDQSAIGPQYWSGWYSSTSSPTYGIDTSSTQTSTSALIETDLIPIGTLLEKTSYEKVIYKVSSPLDNGATVGIKWRANSTDSYTSLTPVNVESATDVSGYYIPNFQNLQWIQLQISLNPITSSNGSFVRLTELRIR